MKSTGKFMAQVSVSGKAIENGKIVGFDKNGLPTLWLNILAGSIPNRQTLTGTVAQRMGIPLDSNGVIAAGESKGDIYSKRTIFGQWLHTGDSEEFGPQFSFTVIKDMSLSSPKEMVETELLLGEPEVIMVEKVVPADYVRKTVHHEGQTKQDSKFHSVGANAIKD